MQRLIRDTFLLLLFLSSAALGSATVNVDIDNSQFQGGNRRIFPQIVNAETLFDISGSSFDFHFKFTEFEALTAIQDFNFGLTIFLDTLAPFANQTFNYSATWDFTDALGNVLPGGSFSDRQVRLLSPGGNTQLQLTGSNSSGDAAMGSAGWTFAGVRVSAILPDLVTLASPNSILVASPDPQLQEAAELVFSGVEPGAAFEITNVPEGEVVPEPASICMWASFVCVSVGLYWRRSRPRE